MLDVCFLGCIEDGFGEEVDVRVWLNDLMGMFGDHRVLLKVSIHKLRAFFKFLLDKTHDHIIQFLHLSVFLAVVDVDTVCCFVE